jgi:hypothetical protein
MDRYDSELNAYRNLVTNDGHIDLIFSDYTVNGIFDITARGYLNLQGILDSSNRPYTDPDFSITSQSYTLTINTPDPIKADGNINIDPPNPTGSIASASGYNTITNINFNMSRIASTDMQDIQVMKNDQQQSLIPSYIGTDALLNDTIVVDITNAIKGDVIYINYKPMLFGSRSPEVSKSSEKVTVVKGHKYHLENVKIWVDSIDVTQQISESSSPWMYINPGSGIDVGIEVDIKHETFASEAYPSNLERVYPLIKYTYLLVTKAKDPFQPKEDNIILKESPPANGFPLTYPNCSYEMANRLHTLYESATLTDSNSYSGTDVELDNEALETTVVDDGNYQIYLIVEDQFEQRSAWCITNIKEDYKIPFRRT